MLNKGEYIGVKGLRTYLGIGAKAVQRQKNLPITLSQIPNGIENSTLRQKSEHISEDSMSLFVNIHSCWNCRRTDAARQIKNYVKNKFQFKGMKWDFLLTVWHFRVFAYGMGKYEKARTITFILSSRRYYFSTNNISKYHNAMQMSQNRVNLFAEISEGSRMVIRDTVCENRTIKTWDAVLSMLMLSFHFVHDA